MDDSIHPTQDPNQAGANPAPAPSNGAAPAGAASVSCAPKGPSGQNEAPFDPNRAVEALSSAKPAPAIVSPRTLRRRFEELARRACMGQTKLKAAFKTAYGTSPAAFVADARIERAIELLGTTDEPISRIARAVGYRKPGAFAEAFHRRTGVAPSAYRRRP